MSVTTDFINQAIEQLGNDIGLNLTSSTSEIDSLLQGHTTTLLVVEILALVSTSLHFIYYVVRDYKNRNITTAATKNLQMAKIEKNDVSIKMPN